MECQVNHTVYSLVGVTPVLDDIDAHVVRPLNYLRYGIGAPITQPAPKMLVLIGRQGQGHQSICSALVNELRRGRSNKRGNVHYENRDVKYLEWAYPTHDHECLSRLFDQAKNQEFTVITIHSFERICPFDTDNRRNGRVSAATKRVLMDHLNTAVPGKVLLVITTSNLQACDADVIGKADHKFNLPLPDAETREEIIWKALENENAELTPYSLMENLIHSTRHDFTIENLLYVVHKAVGQAKARLREQQQNGSGETVVKVMRQDFSRFLDLVNEERLLLAQDQEVDEDEQEDDFDLGEEESEEEGVDDPWQIQGRRVQRVEQDPRPPQVQRQARQEPALPAAAAEEQAPVVDVDVGHVARLVNAVLPEILEDVRLQVQRQARQEPALPAAEERAHVARLINALPGIIRRINQAIDGEADDNNNGNDEIEGENAENVGQDDEEENEAGDEEEDQAEDAEEDQAGDAEEDQAGDAEEDQAGDAEEDAAWDPEDDFAMGR